MTLSCVSGSCSPFCGNYPVGTSIVIFSYWLGQFSCSMG